MTKMQLTQQEQHARKKICLALDNFYDVKAITHCLTELSPLVGMFKIRKSCLPASADVVKRACMILGPKCFWI